MKKELIAKVLKKDKEGRPLKERLDDGQIVTYQYESDDISEDRALYISTYDSRNNLIQEETRDGHVTRYRYDEHNNVIDYCMGDERFPARFQDEPGANSFGW